MALKVFKSALNPSNIENLFSSNKDTTRFYSVATSFCTENPCDVLV